MSKPPPSAPSAAAPAPALAAALASPSPKKKPRPRPGSPVRLARAGADSVTALVKENKKLAAELRQLHQWREAVGGSFKLAWQHERAWTKEQRKQQHAEDRAAALEDGGRRRHRNERQS